MYFTKIKDIFKTKLHTYGISYILRSTIVTELNKIYRYDVSIMN